MNYDRQKFGKTVRTLRGKIPSQDFAKQLRISPAILSRIERAKLVDDPVIEKVCGILGLKISNFPAGKAGENKQS